MKILTLTIKSVCRRKVTINQPAIVTETGFGARTRGRGGGDGLPRGEIGVPWVKSACF